VKERKENEEKSKKIDKIQNDNIDILLFKNPITITLLSSNFLRIKLINPQLTQDKA